VIRIKAEFPERTPSLLLAAYNREVPGRGSPVGRLRQAPCLHPQHRSVRNRKGAPARTNPDNAEFAQYRRGGEAFGVY
jgi:hypothetical protein